MDIAMDMALEVSGNAVIQDAAVANVLQPEEEEASLLGAAVRAVTTMTRPLSYVVASAVFPVKQMLAIFMHKAAFALKKTMANPTKLFRRQPVSPLDPFRGVSGLHSGNTSLLGGIRQVLAVGGIREVGRRAFAPYMANAIVAMSMFHAYTLTRHALAEGGMSSEPLSAGCASLVAGAVQATLNAPLYNLRLRRLRGQKSLVPKSGLLWGLRDLGQHKGLVGLFRNYPFIVAQECCSLGAFFVSFEWVKVHTTKLVRDHVDPSGSKDMYAWASAASVAGVALFAVGLPFENLHEWHASRRTASTPGNVLVHFYRCARPRCRSRVLFSGLKRKLPMAPIAGLPLLAYEVMMQNGYAPVLHQE